LEAIIKYDIISMKIILEREKCIGCGSCVALAPKFFELADDGKSHLKNSRLPDGQAKNDPKTGNEELETEKLDSAQEAADACPVQCIHIIK